MPGRKNQPKKSPPRAGRSSPGKRKSPTPPRTADDRKLKLRLYSGLLQDIAYTTSARFRLETFLERIMDRVLKAVGCESATLFLLDKQKENLVFKVVKGPVAAKLKGKAIPACEGIAGHVLCTGEPYLTPDASKDPKWYPRPARETKYWTRSLLAVPLKCRGKPFGVIEVLNKKDGSPFNNEDLALLKTMAAEVSVVIENANLIMETRNQAEKMKLLTRLSAILNSTLDQRLVRTRAMEAVVELLECETGSLYLIDEEKQELYFEVALGEKGEAVKRIRLKIGEGVSGWVAKHGKSLLVPDVEKDPRWTCRVDKKSRFKTRDMVTVPLKIKGKVIGVLQAINKKGGARFNQEDLKLLESLADQVAIALENARLYEEQKTMFMETAEALATAIEKRDPYTGGHTRRVRDLCMAMARYLPLSSEEKEWLELAAILHDAGKIGVDDHILRKPGRLSPSEFEKMKQHPSYGYEILQHVKPLQPAVPGMKYHHERFDGKGYPEGLKNGKIPLLARIIAVADTWDAMTSDRPYRKGLPDELALKELKRCAGTQFDPQVVRAFIKAYKKGEIKAKAKNRNLQRLSR